MFHSLFSLRSLALAAALLAPAGAARAGDPPPCVTYKTVISYVQVTAYETRLVAYTRNITCYDECGRPYTVSQVCYRAVQVPVTRTVAVARQVRVCY